MSIASIVYNPDILPDINNIKSRKTGRIIENSKNKSEKLILPSKFSNPADCNFEGEVPLTYPQAKGIRQTNIILTQKNQSQKFTELEEIFSSIRENSFLNEYSKRFKVTRKSLSSSLDDTKSLSQYLEFSRQMFELVYDKYYSKLPPALSTNIVLKTAADLTKHEDEDGDQLLIQDIFSEPTFSLVKLISDTIEKMTDDEMINCLMLSTHNFQHPINWLLSPAALSIALFNFSLLGLKKTNRDEKYFSKFNLPRVTYLSLTGIFSDIDLEVVNTFSENVQPIMVFDEKTGGPNMLQKGEYSEGHDLRTNKRPFQTISNKALLVPLKCSDDSETKCYTPNDILSIFEDVIIRSIDKFKPAYIVLNCSLIFDEENKTPFWIDEKTMGRMMHILTSLSDAKVIVYPFKFHDFSSKNRQTAFTKSIQNKSLQQQERLIYIKNRYAVAYNDLYVRNCLVNILEGLAGMKTPNLGERSDLRQKYGASIKKAETLYLIGRYYKDHPYYSFLHSKSLGPLARVTEKYLQNSKKSSSVSKNKVFDTIPVVSSDNKAEVVQLIFDNTKKIELNNISQYIIDYETLSVFIFNAKIKSSLELGITALGQLSNFKLSLEFDNETQPNFIVKDDFKEIQINKEDNFIKDAGLCKHGNFIFQVYGTKVSEDNAEKLDSNRILCYDYSGKGEYYPLQLKTPQEILPRHSVTTCAFAKGNKIYLYVFGGQAQPNTLYKNRALDRLPIIDIVEVYETTLPLTSSSEWDYSMIPKEKIYDVKNISFVPYLQSYAHYIEENDQILIMGGSLFKDSVYEWTFPIFEFSVSQKQFTGFDIVLNNARAHSTKKAVKNNLYSRPVITLPIADKNRNFRINQDKKEFEFLIPCDDDNRVFLYSFQYFTKKCEYHEAQHKSDKTEDKASNPTAHLWIPYNTVPFPMRLSAQLQYFLSNSPYSNELLSKLVDWRISLGQEPISDTTINEKVQTIKESIEKEISEIIIDEPLKRIRISQMNNILKFFERKEFSEIFVNKDSRIFVLQKQLEDSDSKKSNIKGNQPFRENNETCEKENNFPNLSNISFNPSDGQNFDSENFEDTILTYNISEIDSECSEIKELVSEMTPKNFKDCISQQYYNPSFLTQSKNNLIVLSQTVEGKINYKRLSFIVQVKKENPDDSGFERISFESCSESVYIYNGCMVCYIDQSISDRYPNVYEQYKNWVLYADIQAAVDKLKKTNKIESNLEFKKLFRVFQDDHINKRCLIVNEKKIFLIGGFFQNFKTETYKNQKRISVFDLKGLQKFKEEEENSFVPVINDMESIKSECLAISNNNSILIFRSKALTTKVEVLDQDGEFQDKFDIKLPKSFEQTSIGINLVNFRGQEELLFIGFQKNKKLEFALFNLKTRAFEQRKVKLVPKDSKKTQILFSGSEVIYSNPQTNDVLMYRATKELVILNIILE